MSQITMTVPDEALALMAVTPKQLVAELRLAAAVKFFEMGRISSGGGGRAGQHSQTQPSSRNSPISAATP